MQQAVTGISLWHRAAGAVRLGRDILTVTVAVAASASCALEVLHMRHALLAHVAGTGGMPALSTGLLYHVQEVCAGGAYVETLLPAGNRYEPVGDSVPGSGGSFVYADIVIQPGEICACQVV
jgi:hypothetical protein